MSLKDLVWMYLGHQEAAWEHTSAMLSLHINMNRRKGAATVSPEKLNPYKRRKSVTAKGSIFDLKQLAKREESI